MVTSIAYAGAHSATMALIDSVTVDGLLSEVVSHVCTGTTRELNVWAKRKHPTARKPVCILYRPAVFIDNGSLCC